jgi:hypothetical protein
MYSFLVNCSEVSMIQAREEKIYEGKWCPECGGLMENLCTIFVCNNSECRHAEPMPPNSIALLRFRDPSATLVSFIFSYGPSGPVAPEPEEEGEE